MALVSLNEYKDYKGISSDTNTNKLVLIIDSVDAYIKGICNRTFTDFYSSNKTVYVDGNTREIFLKEIPVISIVSVKVSYDSMITSTTLVAGADYVATDESVQSLLGNFISTENRIRNTEIVYTGGYTVATIPSDLKLAALDLVDYYYKEDFTPRLSGMGGSKTNTIITRNPPTIPAHISRVLNNYIV